MTAYEKTCRREIAAQANLVAVSKTPAHKKHHKACLHGWEAELRKELAR